MWWLLLFLFASLNAEDPVQLTEKAILQYMENKQVPGVAVILYYEGKPHFLNYGVMNQKTEKPVTPNTIFELGSITKSFTAVALAAEVLKGNVKLADPAVKYLPGLEEFKGPFSHVTLQHLATHTAGFPHAPPKQAGKTYEQSVKFLHHWQPPQAIGTKYQYSNYGFGLLGLALERATRKNYMQLVTDTILGPLQMHHTFIKVPEALQADYAQGYKKTGEIAARWPITLIAPAGALRSNAIDMAKFLAACLDITGTPPQVRNAIQLSQEGNFKVREDQTQVMSWMKTQYPGYTIYSKNGGVTGFATFMGYIPEYKTGIVILANKNAGNTQVGQWILKELGSGFKSP